jgi:hypothetical protein
MGMILKTPLTSAVCAVAVALMAAGPATAGTASRAAAAAGGCATDPSWPGATCPTHPVVPWEGQGWHHMSAVPGALYTGRNYPFTNAPHVLFIIWDNWKAHSAYGRGYVQRAHQYRVGILLRRARTHDGRRYFSRMTWWRQRDGAREKTRWAFRHREWVRTQPWHEVR